MHNDLLKSIAARLYVCWVNSFYERPPTLSGKRKGVIDDDTPKSFLRLTKRKTRKELIAEGKIESKKESAIKIQPGESFQDFKRYYSLGLFWFRRVDVAIPIRMGGMNQGEKRPKKKKLKSNADEEDESLVKKKRYTS